MLIASQIRAARALLGIDQRQLAEMAGVSLPTIQRMEASNGEVRGTVDKLMKLIRALEGAGIEILGEHAPSTGTGRGVRLRETQAGQSFVGNASLPYDRRPTSRREQP
ncbi:helix-turn-helix transcriptional regulator [Sphingobium sp. Sx8-8]|uniref:helix-turn-helix domain-containing protein n=1 Tax=Sphingobium sp. Sx8-8 TaxID=2933617 RepID=UPI001F5AD479|nr:helix-turn-helix transcriptional regulator [Sphingobium sp. Sx8-8]